MMSVWLRGSCVRPGAAAAVGVAAAGVGAAAAAGAGVFVGAGALAAAGAAGAAGAGGLATAPLGAAVGLAGADDPHAAKKTRPPVPARYPRTPRRERSRPLRIGIPFPYVRVVSSDPGN